MVYEKDRCGPGSEGDPPIPFNVTPPFSSGTSQMLGSSDLTSDIFKLDMLSTFTLWISFSFSCASHFVRLRPIHPM